MFLQGMEPPPKSGRFTTTPNPGGVRSQGNVPLPVLPPRVNGGGTAGDPRRLPRSQARGLSAAPSTSPCRKEPSAGWTLPIGHLQDVEHRQVALVLAELELGPAAERVVRARIGADAAEDAT